MFIQYFTNHWTWQHLKPAAKRTVLHSQALRLRKGFDRHQITYEDGNGKSTYSILAGGFNPFEKHSSNWIVSPSRGKNKKCLKPPPSIIWYLPVPCFAGSHYGRPTISALYLMFLEVRTYSISPGEQVKRWNSPQLLVNGHGVIPLMEEILHQLICSLSHYLQGLIHPRWCRISSINSSGLYLWVLLKSWFWERLFSFKDRNLSMENIGNIPSRNTSFHWPKTQIQMIEKPPWITQANYACPHPIHKNR